MIGMDVEEDGSLSVTIIWYTVNASKTVTSTNVHSCTVVANTKYTLHYLIGFFRSNPKESKPTLLCSRANVHAIFSRLQLMVETYVRVKLPVNQNSRVLLESKNRRTVTLNRI